MRFWLPEDGPSASRQPPAGHALTFLERTFQLNANGTTVRTEVLVGFTTFLTMAYIILVNPSILSTTGMPAAGVAAATCLAAGIGCLMMGLIAGAVAAKRALLHRPGTP